MLRLSTFCRYRRADGVPQRSVIVSLVVGTILSLINEGDALFAGRRLQLVKLVLTYCVAPYGVVSGRFALRQTAEWRR
jgi:hypothetical protein